MKLRYNIFGWLSVPALLLTAACSENADMNIPDSDSENGKNIVTLSVNPVAKTATRADGETNYPVISDGTKADMLVYAVYKKKTDSSTGKISYEVIIDEVNEKTNGVMTIKSIKFPLTIRLIMDPESEYTVAFWAQSQDCKAYDTNDLQKVKVDYSQITNNYEFADAFCAVATVKGNAKDQSVYLHRPLAQINVGDAGWDYEAAAILYPNPRTYAKSTVTIKGGLAKYYNVLEARTLTDDDLENGESAIEKNNVTFSLSTMPAFFNLEAYDSSFDWSKLSYLPYSEKFGPEDEDTEEPLYDEEIENFLRLPLVTSDGKDYLGYIGWDNTKNVKENYGGGLSRTETFKYLSMVYVLAPVAYEEKDGQNVVKGAILNGLSFSASDAEGNNTKELFSINNVPVQQNWRTNIVTDKLFLAGTKFKLYIVPTYAGDYNDESGRYTGFATNDWNNVTIKQDEDADGNKLTDADGNPIYVAISNTDENGNNVNENPEFPGYTDQGGEYNDWDAKVDAASKAQ